MAGDMLAKDYKVSHSAAKALVKIVDVNLERAGINTSRSIFTEDDDRLVEELVAKELEESGSTTVRRGFWEKVHKEYFAGRGFTAEMLISRRRNQLFRKNQKTRVESRSPAVSTSQTKDTNFDDPDAHSGDKQLTDADFKVIAELVQKDIGMSKGKRVQVRPGFWAKVLEDHFSNRGLSPKQLKDHFSYKKRQMKVTKDTRNAKSSDLFTDAEDTIIRDAVAQHKQEHGSDKLPTGFWPSVVENFSMRRDAGQLSRRWYYLKQTSGAISDTCTMPGGFSEEEIQSMEKLVREELKAAGSERVSEPEPNPPTSAVEDETTNESSTADTVPLTNDLIVLPAYQATTAKYPPQSPVTYRPSSGKSDVFGRVLEVGIYPSQDNLYVYTIVDDAGGQQHKRMPERFLRER